MSKVLVDRELLENCRDAAKDAHAASLLKELEAILEAQPAEAEGVDIIGYMDGDYRRDQPSIYIPHVRIVKSCAKGEALMTVTQHLAALSAVTAERDAIAARLAEWERSTLVRENVELTAERDKLQRNLKFTEQWYAERFERLADLGKSAGCWDAMAAIIANGTADPYEPPTYAQQLVRANHRADVAERERDQLSAEVETWRAAARWSAVRMSGMLASAQYSMTPETTHEVLELHHHVLAGTPEKIEWLAAMAAKEA